MTERTMRTGVRSFDSVLASRAIPVREALRLPAGLGVVQQGRVEFETKGEVRGAPVPDHVILVFLGPRHESQEFFACGRREEPGEGPVTIAPAGIDLTWRLRVATPTLHIQLGPELYGGLLAAHGLDGGQPIDPCFRQARTAIERIGLDLMLEMSRVYPAPRVYFEEQAVALALGLSPRGESLLRKLAPLKRGDYRRVARACALVEERLGGDIGLMDLAGEAGVSPAQFSRMFRQRMGQSPYAYVTARRIKRARALLADTRLNLADIALACGFADQSHFTARFRRLVGVTPARFRASLWL